MKKSYPIQIWFFDDNLVTSAEYQTNKTLESSIRGCIQALLSSYFYMNGIRSQKFYKYYFDKDKIDIYLSEYFPYWPFKKKPSFALYNSKTSKWCRSCKEHFDIVKLYLECLFNEYEYRFSKTHTMYDILDWFNTTPNKLPAANLKTIIFPWKVINPRYRNKDVCLSYRTTFLRRLTSETIFEEFKDTKRNIPDYIINYFKLDLN
jgi:hypothetical protein